jgi:hypothetical protein
MAYTIACFCGQNKKNYRILDESLCILKANETFKEIYSNYYRVR